MTSIRITPEYVEHQQYVLSSIYKWKSKSACLSTYQSEDFYHTSENHLKALAKKYCHTCPVRNNCLYTSLVNQEIYGLWGGFTPRQRKAYFKLILDRASKDGVDTNYWSSDLDEYFKHYSNSQIFLEES